MEDMFLPMHMMNPVGFGDVLLQGFNSSGVLVIKNTSQTPCQGVRSNTIVEFRCGGTGFLIASALNTQVGSFYILGLVLTAAHVVCKIGTLQPKSSEFQVLLENGSRCLAYFIRSYVHDYPHDMLSEVRKLHYCLPGDVAILLLVSKKPELVNHYPLANQMTRGSHCFVSGYPQRPDDLAYCFPEGKDRTDLETIVEQAFNSFHGIVHSEGEIIGMSETLIDISCSTTSGMSGGAVVSESEIVGVYVGGPPIEGQRELLQALHSVENDEIRTVYNNIQNFKDLDIHFTENIFERKLVDPIEQCYAEAVKPRNSKNNNYPNIKSRLIREMYDMLYTCVTHYKTPKEFSTNTAVSIQHLLFEDVRDKVNKFQTLDRLPAADIDEIIAHLNAIN